jgi:hypothetical protein
MGCFTIVDLAAFGNEYPVAGTLNFDAVRKFSVWRRLQRFSGFPPPTLADGL